MTKPILVMPPVLDVMTEDGNKPHYIFSKAQVFDLETDDTEGNRVKAIAVTANDPKFGAGCMLVYSMEEIEAFIKLLQDIATAVKIDANPLPENTIVGPNSIN